MPEKTPEEIAEEKKIADQKKADMTVDPFVLRLLESTGKTVEQILEPTVDDKKLAPPDLEAQLKAEAEAKAAKEKEEKEAKEKAEAEAKAKEEEARKKAEVVQPVRPVVLQKKEAAPDPKAAEDAAAKKAREEEEAYIAELTPEQQDELEVARFAETSKKKPGLYKQTLEFYRKFDKFVEENPDLTVDSEAYIKFKEDHEPKLSPAERRRLERDMIATQAVEKATQETRKEFEPVVRELNEIKTAPIVRGVLSEVEALMVAKPEGDALAIEPEIFQKVRSMPYSKALEEYPVEAPIVVGTVAAAQEWTRIWNGVVQINPENPTHRWIMDFIAAEEMKMAARPAEETTRDGRKFIPLGKLVQLQESDPGLARQYWSFDQSDVVNRISRHGVEQYNSQIKKLERSGFVRKTEKKSDANEVEAKKKAEAAAASGSPKATAHTMVGAGDEAGKKANGDLPPHLRAVMAASQS